MGTRPKSQKLPPLPPVVAAIQQIKFTGNVIPRSWFTQITMKNGKPDLNAIIILSEILYRYRPIEVIDEKTGKHIGYRKSFKGPKWQCNSGYFKENFGFSKDQSLDAIKRLTKANLVTKELCDKVVINGIIHNNVMYLEPIPKSVLTIVIAGIEGTN